MKIAWPGLTCSHIQSRPKQPGIRLPISIVAGDHDRVEVFMKANRPELRKGIGTLGVGNNGQQIVFLQPIQHLQHLWKEAEPFARDSPLQFGQEQGKLL